MENYYNNQGKFSWLHRQIPFGVALLVILISAGGVLKLLDNGQKNISTQIQPYVAYAKQEDVVTTNVPDDTREEADYVPHFSPGPISMDLMKSNGCVADGILSGYGDKTKEIVATINRSKCTYLHRALETWLKAPDFSEAFDIMEKIENRPMVYGMFLAEAISTRKKYEDPILGETHRYDQMCREGTEGRWGADTCIPSVDNVAYRRYLKAVTQRAMDLGIQSFLFGQLQLQDEQPNFANTEMKGIIDDMHQYANERGMQIVIGGQTDDIVDEKYLKLFDYIEGGVGIDSEGNVENQPCFSAHQSCWALLWDKRYSSKANNVFLHLDWSGLVWDDMGVFARMPQDKRIQTLNSLYKKFTSQKMGFMMPFLAVLNKENDGCYGPNKHFYVPSNKYKCQDENQINRIMRNVPLQSIL